VSRDRAGAYADGAARGAPQAKQIADTWHLAKNLGDAVEDYVKRNRIKIPAAGPLEQPSYPAQQAAVENTHASEESRSQARQDEQSRDQRQDLWKQAHTLHEQGYGVRTIAKLLGLARNTVRRYLKMEAGWHVAARPKRRSLLDPYRDYLFTRWTAGEHNGNQLTREIRTQGYQGCDTLAREAITHLRRFA
jgi:transposase